MGIKYTHTLDLLHKLTVMASGLIVVGAATELIRPLATVFERHLIENDMAWLWTLITIAYGIGGYIAAIVLLSKTLLPPWLPTFIRVRFLLATEISALEAEKMNFLFDGTLGGAWYPLWSLRKVDAAYRKEALLRFTNRIASDHGLQKPSAMPEDFQRQERQGARANPEPNAHEKTPRKDSLTSSSLSVLGLQEMPADFTNIKQAYRRKVAQFHPDKFANEPREVIRYAEETTKTLNAAYAHLEQVFKKAMT